MSATTTNPYKVPYGFVDDPFVPLYQQLDEEISYKPSAQALLDYARELEELLPGDFDLGEVITEIKSNTLSFVRTGLMAYRVKLLKLYRQSYRSFKEFCEKAIGITHWQINRNIEAARVVIELAMNGFKILPKNEAQARPLTKLTGADLYSSWKSIVNSNPEHKITGSTIAEALGIEVKSKSVHMPPELYYALERKALRAGKSTINQYLQSVIDEDNEIDKVDEEKIKLWQADLEALITEQHFEDGMPIVTASDRLDDIEDEIEIEPIVTVSEPVDEVKSLPIGQVSSTVNRPKGFGNGKLPKNSSQGKTKSKNKNKVTSECTTKSIDKSEKPSYNSNKNPIDNTIGGIVTNVSEQISDGKQNNVDRKNKRRSLWEENFEEEKVQRRQNKSHNER